VERGGDWGESESSQPITGKTESVQTFKQKSRKGRGSRSMGSDKNEEGRDETASCWAHILEESSGIMGRGGARPSQGLWAGESQKGEGGPNKRT